MCGVKGPAACNRWSTLCLKDRAEGGGRFRAVAASNATRPPWLHFCCPNQLMDIRNLTHRTAPINTCALSSREQRFPYRVRLVGIGSWLGNRRRRSRVLIGSGRLIGRLGIAGAAANTRGPTTVVAVSNTENEDLCTATFNGITQRWAGC